MAWIKKDPAYEHHLLEALWVHQWHNVVDKALLDRVLTSTDARARAAAARVLCYWRDRMPETLALFKKLAADESPRVRIEAVRAASFFSGADVAAANEVAYTSLLKTSDYYLDYCYRETIGQLRRVNKDPFMPTDPVLLAAVTKKQADASMKEAKEKSYGPTRKLDKAEKRTYDLGKEIYNRDAHCVTCHQPDGNGLPGLYPALTHKEWLSDDERVIKIVLKGLSGPAEIAGKKYPGVPPMTGFAPLLKDNEIAAVISYVRQSFKNDLDPIKADEVQRIRKAIDAKAGVYTIEEILKEHPLTAGVAPKAK